MPTILQLNQAVDYIGAQGSFMKLPRTVRSTLHYSPHCQPWLAPSNPLLLLELIKVKPNFLLNPFY